MVIILKSSHPSEIIIETLNANFAKYILFNDFIINL